MPGNDDRRSRDRRTIVLRRAERLFVTAGVVVLAWCAWLLGDARLSQWQARGALEVVSLAATIGPPDDANITGATHGPAAALHAGSVIGALSIPRVTLDAIVLHGSDAQTLRRAPGHLENTALPGQSGNVVIAGHRDSFFRPLKDVTIGDDVFIDTADWQFHYRVTSIDVVSAHDVSVLDHTAKPTLTLITCYPFWVLGPAPDRFVVRGALVATIPFAMGTVATPASPTPVAADVTPVVGARERSTAKNLVVHNDATLVRQAIERFRLTYNARLASHHDPRPGGLLQFHVCDIALAENRAIARCTTNTPSELEKAGLWTINLERTDQGWAIKTLVSE